MGGKAIVDSLAIVVVVTMGKVEVVVATTSPAPLLATTGAVVALDEFLLDTTVVTVGI